MKQEMCLEDRSKCWELFTNSEARWWKTFLLPLVQFKFKFRNTLLILEGKQMLLELIHKFLQGVVVDADGCWQEGSHMTVCTTTTLKMPLTEDRSVVVWQSNEEIFSGFWIIFFICMKNISLHKRLQWFNCCLQNRSNLLYQVGEPF